MRRMLRRVRGRFWGVVLRAMRRAVTYAERQSSLSASAVRADHRDNRLIRPPSHWLELVGEQMHLTSAQRQGDEPIFPAHGDARPRVAEQTADVPPGIGELSMHSAQSAQPYSHVRRAGRQRLAPVDVRRAANGRRSAPTVPQAARSSLGAAPTMIRAATSEPASRVDRAPRAANAQQRVNFADSALRFPGAVQAWTPSAGQWAALPDDVHHDDREAAAEAEQLRALLQHLDRLDHEQRGQWWNG